MSNQNQEPFDLSDVELKMPEENFLGTESEAKTKKALPIILIVIILMLLVVLGGLLWWGVVLTRPTPAPETIPTVTRPTPEENNEPESTNAEAEASVIRTISSSVALKDIKADLTSTDFTNLTKEMVTIDNLINEATR